MIKSIKRVELFEGSGGKKEKEKDFAAAHWKLV